MAAEGSFISLLVLCLHLTFTLNLLCPHSLSFFAPAPQAAPAPAPTIRFPALADGAPARSPDRFPPSAACAARPFSAENYLASQNSLSLGSFQSLLGSPIRCKP